MRLGIKGDKWLAGLIPLYTDASSLCTTWQQEFFQSFSEKAEKFGDEAYVTEKQLFQLNKIAEIYGYPELEQEALDHE